MKFILTIHIFFFLNTFALFSQIHKEWVKSLGSSGNDNGLKICNDNDGNIIITGYYNTTTDFDMSTSTYNLTPKGNNDIFIAKYNSNGAFIWAISLGGIGDDKPKDIFIHNNEIYITGYFSGTAYFDPNNSSNTIISKGNYDIFFAKYSSSGSLSWAKSIGGTGPDVGRGISTDSLGNVILYGDFNATVDFDPGSGVYNLSTADIPGIIDVFFAKYDFYGNFQWVKQLKGTNYNSAKSIFIDNLQYIYITGIFFYTIDFDPNIGVYNLTATTNSCDVYIAKYSIDGNFIWAKSFGGIRNDFSNSINIFNSSLYVFGHFQETVDFDPGSGNYSITSSGLHDIYLSKFDTSGNFIWVKTFGSSGSDLGLSSNVDTDGNVYISGAFSNTVDFNTVNLTSLGNYDSYFCQISPSGSLEFIDKLGSTDDDRAVSISLYNNEIYLLGFYKNILNFDISPYSYTSKGQEDCYIAKYYHCVPHTYLQNFSIPSYDSIFFNNQYIHTTGIYFDTLYDLHNCDSIVKLNLLVIDNPLPIELLSFKVICTQTGSLVTWTTASETNNDYFTIEKSTDLMNWKVVSTLSSSFNSNEIKNYAIEDNTINPNELTYYRLKQTDFDGHFKYFDVYSILCNLPNTSLEIIGVNVSEQNINIMLKTNGFDPVEIDFYDIYGRLITHKIMNPVKGANITTLNDVHLSPGIYLISAIQNGEKKTKKIILY